MHCSKKSAQQSQVADKRSEGGGLGHWMEFIHPSSMMDPGKEIGWNSKNNNNKLKKEKTCQTLKILKPKNLSTCVRIELIDELTTSNSTLRCRKSKFIPKKPTLKQRHWTESSKIVSKPQGTQCWWKVSGGRDLGHFRASPTRSWICICIQGWKVVSVHDVHADLGETATHPALFSILTFEFLLKQSVIF